ncbi:MAG: PspA-associated protein PspAB [Acidimicrobiales bacterium]
MGLLDTILGRTKPVRANLDALFALPSAAVTLQSATGLVSSGSAGVCWKPPLGKEAHDLEGEIAELLALPDNTDPGATKAGVGSFTQAEDSYRYRWLLLEDPEIDDLVTRVHLANSTLEDAGWGPQLLCSLFGFVPGQGSEETGRCFLVYLFKRGTFYPFVPSGAQKRDNEMELRLKATIGDDLPVEADLSRWFPLWDAPVH